MPTTRDRNRREARSLAAAGIAGIIGGLVAALALPADGVPLSGSWSLGSVTALAAAAVGAPTIVWSYVASSRGRPRWRQSSIPRRVLDTTGLVLAGCGMAFLLILSVYALFQRAFQDLEVDRLGAIVLAAATLAATAYVLALIVGRVTTTSLATLLGLFLTAGVFASMLTVDDPAWWQLHFSALGAGGAISAFAFNLTLVVAGLVLITLADYLTQDLQSRSKAPGAGDRGVLVVRIVLIVIGVALTGVGLVPVDASLVVHNLFAISMLVAFGALMVLVPLLIGELPRSFVITTIVFAAGLVLAVLLFYPIGYYNLTAVELIAVILIFVWLLLFTRHAAEPVEVADAAVRVKEPDADRTASLRTQVGLPARLSVALLAVGAFVVGTLTGWFATRRGPRRLR